MNPLDLDTRVGRLEQDAARLGQRVDDLTISVRTFGPMVVTMARLEENVKVLGGDVAECARSVAEVRRAIDERERTYSAERKSLRVAMLSLSGVILAALLSAAATLLASGVHP